MPSRQHVVRAIYGAWRLALLDARGMSHFELTIEGFWRSFFAAVVVAPAYAILVALGLGERAPIEAAPEAFFLVKLVTYLVGWAAFPVVMIALARVLSLSSYYVSYIVAYNWSQVIQIAVLLPVTLLERSGALPEGMASMLVFLATLAILFYQWFVARGALQTTGWIAAGLVFVDVVLGVFIDVAGNSLL